MSLDGNEGHEDGHAYLQRHCIRQPSGDRKGLLALLASDTAEFKCNDARRDRVISKFDANGSYYTIWHTVYATRPRYPGQPATYLQGMASTPLYIWLKQSLYSSRTSTSSVYLARSTTHVDKSELKQPDYVVEANASCTQFRIRHPKSVESALEIAKPQTQNHRVRKGGAMFGDLHSLCSQPQRLEVGKDADVALLMSMTMCHVRLVTECLMMNPWEWTEASKSCSLLRSVWHRGNTNGLRVKARTMGDSMAAATETKGKAVVLQAARYQTRM